MGDAVTPVPPLVFRAFLGGGDHQLVRHGDHSSRDTRAHDSARRYPVAGSVSSMPRSLCRTHCSG